MNNGIIFGQFLLKWNEQDCMNYSTRIINELEELFTDNDEYVSPQPLPANPHLQFFDHQPLILIQYHPLLHHNQLFYDIPQLLPNIPQQPLNMELHLNLLLLFQKFCSQILTPL